MIGANVHQGEARITPHLRKMSQWFQLSLPGGPTAKDVNHHLFPQRSLEHAAEVNLLSVEPVSSPPCA